MILNKYKGSKRKGKYIINKPPQSLIDYCKDKHVGRYIYPLKHRSSQGFTLLLCDTFEKYSKKRIGINILRKSYTSYMFKKNPHMSEHDKGKISKAMGTSIRMLQLIYRKI